MTSEIIPFPEHRRMAASATEQEAWDAYLDAMAAVHAEYPVVNVRTLKRCVDAYERFCFLLTNGGSAA